MTKRSWLHHFFGRFSRPLLLHISPFLLCSFYWWVMWNGLLLNIFSKKLIKSRIDFAKLARRLESVLLPSTYSRTLWSDDLRSLLLLVVCGPSDLHSKLFGLSSRTVRLHRSGDRDRVSDHAYPWCLRSFFCLEPFE